MPNTDPVCDNQAQVKFLLEKAAALGLARIIPVSAITMGRKGLQLTEMGELKEVGSPAVSDDGNPVMDAEVMRRAMEYAAMTDTLIISHCEDKALSGEGVMHEGYWSTVLGMKPIPAEAESIMVDRDIRIAALTGARLHIAHVSTAQSVEMIRCAKKAGVRVTAEATPHHFTLTDEELKTYDARFKVNPPLRSAKDVSAVVKGLDDGTIEVIATDHAPHPIQEKEREFDHAPFGMIGLETALSLAVMKLVEEGYLGWPGLISALSTAPCRILKYDRGTLVEGAVADITIIDPTVEWTYTQESIRSLSKNSPFIGWTLKGKVMHVLIGGRIIFGSAA
jgi:dihydroorotase